MSVLLTRASSINRALDEIGDRWSLLILQEAFWGGSTFGDLLAATGASRGVLSDRLKWLQGIDCLRRRDGRYRLTRKSLDLYDTGWQHTFVTRTSDGSFGPMSITTASGVHCARCVGERKRKGEEGRGRWGV